MYISDLFTVAGCLNTAGFKNAYELILPSVYSAVGYGGLLIESFNCPAGEAKIVC